NEILFIRLGGNYYPPRFLQTFVNEPIRCLPLARMCRLLLKQRVLILILISVMFLPISSRCIPNPPCACSSFTTIGSPGNETNISSLTGGLAPNTCYFIRGTLVINVATVWSNVRLRMDEGSMIRLDEGLIVLDSYIEGCDVMWRGI